MTSEARDIVERLREPRHNEDLMKRWDSWRKYISEGGGASWPRDAFESVIDCIDEERQEAAEEIRRLREALERLVNAKALAGVRGLVAGWNGEGKPDGPYDRHPNGLGATLPKTNCGRVYELDEAMCAARQALDPRP